MCFVWIWEQTAFLKLYNINITKHYQTLPNITKCHYYYRHVSLSAPIELLGSHGADFHDICCLTVFRKIVETIQILLKVWPGQPALCIKANRHFA
jgi:hypothetical protein